MRNKIIIITGDPNSINSEIIYKCWKNIDKSTKKKIYFVSNKRLLQSQFKSLGYRISLSQVKNIYEMEDESCIKILNIDLKFKNPFNVDPKDSSKFIINSLNLGHKISLNDDVQGLINCAINKNLLKKRGLGVTEFLAKKCNINNNFEVMLIKNKSLSVVPITTHIDIKRISLKLNKNLIINKIITANNWFKKQYKRKPKIGILGLNPHNAELRKKSEEVKIIIPSISKLKKNGINVDGPLVSDTIFIQNYKKYDMIIGMYHDQVLIPFKTLFKFDAINITLGLKYLRVSPDHGTAVNLIKKNKADYRSLKQCIEFVKNSKV